MCVLNFSFIGLVCYVKAVALDRVSVHSYI